MAFRVLLASGLVSITSVYLYARYLHHSLASQVESTHVTAEERSRAYASGEIETLPLELLQTPSSFRIVHVKDEKAHQIALPWKEEDAKELFTKLLRRNNSCFSRTPQSYILRMMAKTQEQKQSFSRAHIETLDFEDGDLFCGFNRVLKREPLEIEIELVPPASMGDFAGRLVITLSPLDGDAVLRTQTVQWTRTGSPSVLPLERGVAKFLHEIVSWWLIVTGLKFLERMTAKSRSE